MTAIQPSSTPAVHAHTHTPEPEEPTREELHARCGSLAQDSDILARVAEEAVRGGYAGPTSGLRLTYLGATTRLFAKPVSIALRGPSSAGKSYTIKQALAFLPPEAYVEMTAMSEKALIYLDEDLSHRVLVVFEGAGVSGDFTAYAVRSLLSEGRLEYVYTDFDRKRSVRITKEGPTGLITSTAGRIDHELATRVITPNVEDSPDLTRAIIQAAAHEAEGDDRRVDYLPYQDLQRYIANGPREVVVPFARRIAELTDVKAVRLRRDFAAALCLVQANALLQQQTRQTDAQGRIVATLHDYSVVYDLIGEMVAEAAGSSIPPTLRETFETLNDLELPPPARTSKRPWLSPQSPAR